MSMTLVNEIFKCSVCEAILPIHLPGSTGKAGYARIADRQICFDCVARIDVFNMLETGKTVLYFQEWDGSTCKITNWPGTLVFAGIYKKGKHNIGGIRYDCWFRGPDGAEWHGVNIGDNAILRCHRLKKQDKQLTPLTENQYLKPYNYDRQ